MTTDATAEERAAWDTAVAAALAQFDTSRPELAAKGAAAIADAVLEERRKRFERERP